MRPLRVGILDLVTKSPTRSLWARVMHPNLASIMPQAIGAWCQQAGHDVTFVCFTGPEDLVSDFPEDMDILFIGAFTQAAQLSYALSNLFRQRGVVTVLGGPHARCYPDDAVKYFDYVLGFTNREMVEEVLQDCSSHPEEGRQMCAGVQPPQLPSIEERWPFVAPTIAKSPTKIKAAPMLSSLGCPYTCSFCIDSVVKYQPFDADQLRDELRFVANQLPGAWIGWHDPNFGVRFDEIMTSVEAVGPGRLTHAAESSLSLLSEDRMGRLRDAGFVAILPGVESWYSLGNKSKTGSSEGRAKVDQVSAHLNTLMEYVPYVQANFVLGLDCDEGPEPFELTKEFVDKTPGVFPGYSLLSAFGEAAPLNLEYQETGRVLPFPFHFLNNNGAMNVRPKNYDWPEFYDHVIDVTRYTFSRPRILKRAKANRGFSRWLNVVRAVSSEGAGRIKYYTKVRRMLDEDRQFRAYFEGETREIPDFFVDQVKNDLGPLWEYLPDGALYHDELAYLKKTKRLLPLSDAPPAVAAAN